MISSPGIGSNIDVNSIVSQLMAIEALPLNQLDRQEAVYQAKLSTLGQIKSALASFESAVKNLTDASDKAVFSTTVSDSGVLNASASESASVGKHTINVTSLATSQTLVAAGQASTTGTIGTGATTTITISYGTIAGGTFDSNTGTYTGATFSTNATKTALTFDIGNSDNTLEGIRDAINALDADVTASIVNDGSGTPYRLAINNASTGVANSLKIEVSGDAAIGSLLGHDPAATQNLSQTQAAGDAAFTADGIPIVSSENSISDVIGGLTLTLKSTGTTTVGISRDTGKIRSALEELSSKYNDLNKLIDEATGLEAILQGDRAPVFVQNRLRAALSTSQSGVSQNFSTLSQLGLSFQRDGSLKFENTKLQAAIETSSTDVRAVVAAFGTSLTTLAEQLTGDNGPLNSRSNGITRSVEDLQDRRIVINRRLETTEERLRSQFTALDSLISGLLATSSYLEQQLANLPKITNQNR